MGEVIKIKSGKSKLTNKQMKFCQELVYGVDDEGKPLSQSEAYRRSYNTKGTDKTVWMDSSKLIKNPRVTLMIKELRDQKQVSTQASLLSDRDYVLQNIKKIIENPEENASARVRGLELLGKHHSLWTDTVELKQTNADELKQQLATRLDDLLADTGTGGN